MKIQDFIPFYQLITLRELRQGEEGEFFRNKIKESVEIPGYCGQDGKGKEAICYLHFFNSGEDFWATEAWAELGRITLFGWFKGRMDNELAYISMPDLEERGMEIDLYFSPKTVKETLKE